ncbi:hypothetical protein HDE79_004166 [Rhodanobacter sp. MP1X3]|nr:hypothetical protein [Rhodanobacter sp. MP1X3]
MIAAQEAVALAVRRKLWLSLDDLLVVVLEFLNPAASRSGLARCLRRHTMNTSLVENKGAPIVRKTFKDYASAFVYIDVRHLPQMADETARVTTDHAARWVYLRIYADQSEASSTDFPRGLHAVAPMRIEKLLTDNISRFTDHFKGRSGHHAFNRECVLLGIEHRLIKQRHPQTGGMVERFNGRTSDTPATTRLRSREELQITIEPYVKIYNEQLSQRSVCCKTLRQATRAWHEQRSNPFVRKTKNQMRLDTAVNPRFYPNNCHRST